jgi:hypothetical protein
MVPIRIPTGATSWALCSSWVLYPHPERAEIKVLVPRSDRFPGKPLIAGSRRRPGSGKSGAGQAPAPAGPGPAQATQPSPLPAITPWPTGHQTAGLPWPGCGESGDGRGRATARSPDRFPGKQMAAGGVSRGAGGLWLRVRQLMFCLQAAHSQPG